MILDRLFEMQDKEYAAFQSKLTPGVAVDAFIGVRVPQCRAFAKELVKASKTDEKVSAEVLDFLNTLPHKYYDENMLHGLILSEYKDFDECLAGVEKFLPYVDNWAVCDIMSPKVFAKHKLQMIQNIQRWTQSNHVYTIRFGIEILMRDFLDEDFAVEFLQIPAAVQSEEYYVNMMIAWFFATALAKQWNATIPFIEQKRLGVWTHNKTIQKAKESYRITEDQKKYLSDLKVKG